jgi:hypothetical protein
MWWQNGIETKIMPNELGIDSKQKQSWNMKDFYDYNTRWFHVELFQINDAILERHPW